MTPIHRVAFIGNQLPRRCGIATFTHDLHAAVVDAHRDVDTFVMAMNDAGRTYDYPVSVRFQIDEQNLSDYHKAGDYLNNADVDVVCLQHEYGIFGGDAGAHIVELLERLDMPIVTTLHTVLTEPSQAQKKVMRRIIKASTKMIVMAEKGKDVLSTVHDVPARKIDIIAHGIPEFPFVSPDVAKGKFGFAGRTVLLTFGLLSPNKGVGTMLDAMPDIIKSCPNVVYVILGATHPNLVRENGEAYRDSLLARVQELGIQNHVVFVDRFVDQAMLLEYISMCDVYVTPYLSESQMTSGTLAYSFGLGKPVVSTPYWHAKELLADGRGILVPFGDARAIGSEIAALLTDQPRRHLMGQRAYETSRGMTWERTAQRYLETFASAISTCRSAQLARGVQRATTARIPALPEFRTGHFQAMCDSAGLMQHAVHSIPDRSHGYCVDDNARALLLACALAPVADARLPEPLTTRFAAFVQHAWNPDRGRFRNFMSYERRWLEDVGSEDSHGRTLWALGVCAAEESEPARRRWAANLFKAALPIVESFSSPRAWAFALLGLNAYCPMDDVDTACHRLRLVLAERLHALFIKNSTDTWPWFEAGLAYDNARLSQALIVTGLALNHRRFLDAGLESLRWLMLVQTSPSGCFRPVGSESFGAERLKPALFDQQPVEAAATISACLAAWRADACSEWQTHARRAFNWFWGDNDLLVPLIDPLTGGCKDGLHPDRPNENMGAESVVSYLLGLAEMRQVNRRTIAKRQSIAAIVVRKAASSAVAVRTIAPHLTAGGYLVSIPISQSPSSASETRPGTGRRSTL